MLGILDVDTRYHATAKGSYQEKGSVGMPWIDIPLSDTAFAVFVLMFIFTYGIAAYGFRVRSRREYLERLARKFGVDLDRKSRGKRSR